MILPGTGRGTGEAGGGALPQKAPPEVYAARRLRKNMSLPEVLLWQQLRGKRSSIKFRRQHPIGPYVVDFFAGERALIVELDGAMHDARQSYDAARDGYLKSRGFRIFRIAAAEVLRDPEEVAASIGAFAAPPLHQPAAGPPPRSGEDQE
jgi:very-short-patch-repair endonuclease